MNVHTPARLMVSGRCLMSDRAWREDWRLRDLPLLMPVQAARSWVATRARPDSRRDCLKMGVLLVYCSAITGRPIRRHFDQHRVLQCAQFMLLA